MHVKDPGLSCCAYFPRRRMLFQPKQVFHTAKMLFSRENKQYLFRSLACPGPHLASLLGKPVPGATGKDRPCRRWARPLAALCCGTRGGREVRTCPRRRFRRCFGSGGHGEAPQQPKNVSLQQQVLPRLHLWPEDVMNGCRPVQHSQMPPCHLLGVSEAV